MYRSRVIFERHQEQTIAFVRMALAIATGTHQELLTLPQKVLLIRTQKGPPSLTPQRRKFPPACVTWWTHSVTDIALRPRHAILDEAFGRVNLRFAHETEAVLPINMTVPATHTLRLQKPQCAKDPMRRRKCFFSRRNYWSECARVDVQI